MPEKVAHAILEGVKRGIEAGAAQLRDVCAGEILILRPQLIRSVYKPNIRRAFNRCADGADEVEERPCGAGSDIEQSAGLGMSQQPADDCNTIFDIDKIA